jgi:hypothetical protein
MLTRSFRSLQLNIKGSNEAALHAELTRVANEDGRLVGDAKEARSSSSHKHLQQAFDDLASLPPVVRVRQVSSPFPHFIPIFDTISQLIFTQIDNFALLAWLPRHRPSNM